MIRGMPMSEASERAHQIGFESWSWSRRRSHTVILPMCDQSFSLLLSTDFISNCQFHLLWKLFLFNRVDTIVNLVDMELSCGLWLLILFQVELWLALQLRRLQHLALQFFSVFV